MTITPPQVLLITCGDWHLPRTAKAFAQRGALAGLWISFKNSTKVPAEKFKRCWSFRIAMEPWYRFAPQPWPEKAFYGNFPIWRHWVKSQKYPLCDAVQAIMGYATEPFDYAERVGALKVLDSPTGHPVVLSGYWQRECDLWSGGEKIAIPRWMFARMNRELERADLILCPSKFVLETMLMNGIPESKCFINPFGVDTSIFRPRSSVPPVPRYVCVAPIRVLKGHQYLFPAFQIVKQKFPQAELICVGRWAHDFRRQRPRWEGTFTQIEILSHPELAELLRTCSAFVFPSAQESLARSIIEAMASGLPIIASYESGAGTLVDEGVEGFIIRGRDPQHIAEAMIRVADPELNRRMGEAAHRRGAIGNTWQDYGDRLLAEYGRRLAGRAQKSSGDAASTADGRV